MKRRTTALLLVVAHTVLLHVPAVTSFGITTAASITRTSRQRLTARRRRRDPDDYYDDDDDDDAYDDDDIPRRRRRRSNNGLPPSFGRPEDDGAWRLPPSVSTALLAGVFVLGIGLGVTMDSQINTDPKDLASRDAIDNAAPNPTLCAKLGASAMALDQRVFISFNPFNVYVSPADVKPACVLRESNVVFALQQRGLINDAEVRYCKQKMNTWAFVGSLDDTPQLSCVYKSQDAQNEFLSNPKYGLGEDYLDDDRAAAAAAAQRKQLPQQRRSMLLLLDPQDDVDM